jgi:hypothetical protein
VGRRRLLERRYRQEAEMDLLSIARKLWRYRLLTLPVLALTFCGAVYVVAVKDPVYEASSSYILINPPPPPTEEEIARDPALSSVDADNPFTRFADQSVVVEVLASTLSTESARRALVDAGADSRYTVARASQFGYSSPIVQITGTGESPEAAVRTAELVGEAVTSELNRMQVARGVDSQYRIETQQVDAPDDAELRASGKLRSLVGVLALGTVLLFVLVSVADALATLRMERSERGARPWRAGEDELGVVPGEEAEVLTYSDTEHGRAAARGSRANGHRRQRYTWSAERWLEVFGETRSVAEACRALGIVESTAYRRRRSDADFAEAWDAAERATSGRLEVPDGESIGEPMDLFADWDPEATVSRPSRPARDLPDRQDQPTSSR